MAGTADSAVGAILEIPESALQNIKKAEGAIKQLQATSQTAAQKIKGHFDNTAVSGLNAFIQKVKQANGVLGNITMPKLDATSFAASISQIAQAMATVDKSATTGANRISRIADSITKLSAAQPSAQMFQDIANGITAIGNTSQQTIANVSQLAQTMAQLARDIRTVQNAQSAVANDTATAAQYNKLYKEQADLQRQINEYKRKGSSLTAEEQQYLDAVKRRMTEIGVQLDKLNKKKQTAASELAQVAGEQRTDNVAVQTTTKGAIGYAKQARSLRELQDAYKNLKAVMATVNPKSDAWRQMNSALQQTKTNIDEIKRKMGEFNAQSQRTAGVASQLRNTLAAAFSVSTIYNYMKQMVKVRAEFELQNVALRAILQNKDEADRIFMQVQQMALQSPFTIMQLTTYTKQLAAYRIEADKLVGTTKMLADVSAGLGVDIQRFILAYGQVKAANYLRATEIRQFTEAGLNIAGELAQYFSELQGKMVSVGDVMNMVTKRMVRFEDVEEVFKRVTSAGGLFYDMQKKQAETVRGQIQRISDAMSIMMNEIGKSNQGLISDFLTFIRAMISSWRELMPYVKAFVAALAVGGLTKGLSSVILSLRNVVVLLKSAKTAQDAWNVAAQKNVWGAILGIIVAIGVAIWQAQDATSALAEELDRIRNEAATDLKESIADFHQMAKAATDATKSYTERKEALDALNRSYKEILPSYMLEAEWLEKQAGNYDAATAKIQEYFQAKETQKQVDTILNSSDYTDAVKDMQELGEKMLNKGVFDATVTKKYTDDWMQQIASEIASGKIENSAQAVSKRLSEIFGKDVIISDAQFKSASNRFKELENQINHITLGTVTAKNQAELWDKELEGLSTRQLQQRIEDAKKEMSSLIKEITLIQNTHDFDFERRAGVDEQLIAQNENRLNSLLERYDVLTESVAAYEQAMATAWAKEKSDEINETIGVLQNEIVKVSELTRERDKLARTNTGTEEESNRLKILNNDLEIAKTRTLNLAKEMGVPLTEAELANIDNMFDLERLLRQVAEKAYPKLGKAAVEEAGKGETAIKNIVDKVDLLKRAINSFSHGLGLGRVFEDDLTETNAATEDSAQIAQKLWEIEQKRNEDYIKAAAKRANVDEKIFTANENLVKKRDSSDFDYAKELRAQAKAWKEQKAAVDDMTAAQRKFYFEKNKLSQSVVDEYAKAADAAEDIANAYTPEAANKTKGRAGGTDPWIAVFKEREKAIQDFYKQYETLRDKFSENESQRRDIASFKSYFESVGLNMADVISKGWDAHGLVGNIEQLQSELKKHFGAIYDDAEKIMRKGVTLDVIENPTAEQKLTHALAELIHDLEKQAADNKVKIDFEAQEKALQNLKSNFDDIFANYDITKELGNLGLNVDLTYIVGGKPMTLEQARKELKDTYDKALSEGNLGEDAEKAYKDALGKLADLENKAQKERLKNYQKFLASAYGDSAKVQLDYYKKLTQLQDDFAKVQDDLQKKLASPDISQEERFKIENSLETLPRQAARAAKKMREEMNKELDKISLDKMLKSPLFSEMFQDLGSMTNEVLDKMLVKIQDIQNSANDLTLSQVRQLAQYAEKIENAKLDNSPFKEAYNAIKKAYELRAKGITAEEASNALAVSEEELERMEKLKEDILLVLGLKENTYKIDGAVSIVTSEQPELTKQQIELLGQSNDELREQLNTLDGAIYKQKEVVTANAQNVQIFKNAKNATEKFGAALQEAAKLGIAAMGAIKAGLQVFGKEVGEEDEVWFDFVDNMLSTCITLGIAFVALGIQINSALGIIGLIATALTVVANLFSAILQSHDKRLEKEIGKIQDEVDDLSKAFEKLEKSIERAVSIEDENQLTEQALANIEKQKEAYEEMIRLEKDKKKTSKSKIKEYEEKIEELTEAEEELYEKRHEKYGSTNDVWDEANNWVDAWLDAYKEAGDGLDALYDSWDEFYENLIKKQLVSKVLGDRMNKYVEMINDVIDENMDEYGYIDALKAIGEKFKTEFGDYNQLLIDLSKYAGISGGNGELILSDLQKGIQNITEPQAAAIEAYLNSMRFAVFHHTEQLDTLIATVQAQYGSGIDNPVVTELKGIRSVLDSIDRRLRSVINTQGRNAVVRIGS